MAPVPDMRDAKLERRRGEDDLGRDILDECRVQLMLKFRFLDLALWRMDLVPLRAGARYPLATDAVQVVYDPPRVIARFQESFEESVRDYLHLVMHCIFRHPFDEGHDCREAWSLACDIVAEGAALDLCGARFASDGDAARRTALDEMGMLVGTLLPSKVYGLVRNLMQTPDGQHYRGLGPSTLAEWRLLFERDDHGAWPAMCTAQGAGDDADARPEVSEDDEDPEAQADPLRTDSPGEDGPSEGGGQDAGQGAAGQQPEDAGDGQDDDAGAGQDAGFDDDGDDADGDAPERQLPADDEHERRRKEWEDVARQIEVNLETFSRQWGEEAGGLMACLAFANRPTCGYADFLRRFMVPSEEMRLNLDEFDYLSYTYGLELYGNMPLIEPLEYKEVERVRSFAIVIDTSESVRGDTVRRFVRHTFDILKSSEDYASEVSIHLIQCDARVQSDTRITSLKDVDALMEGFQVRGFGGTDFRPAFDYVDMLRKRGELEDMKGLIYFTDGLGQFPERAPDYEAAFVFVDEEGIAPPPVPPWACKVLIDEAGIGRWEEGAGN